MVAASAIASAKTSMQTCTASVVSARLCDTTPPQNSSAATAAAKTSASVRRRCDGIDVSRLGFQRFEHEHGEHRTERRKRTALRVFDDARVPRALRIWGGLGLRNERRDRVAIAIEGFAKLRAQKLFLVRND